jgi:hypothetical protein
MSDVDYLIRKLAAGTVTVKHGIQHHNLTTVPFRERLWSVKSDRFSR